MTDSYILEMKNITKNFPGVKALDDVTLRVRQGTVHSLLGENGAGKSTLMKCLFGIYSVDGGEIMIGGKKVSFDNPAQALENHVSMVHQELNQVLDRSVMENVWLGRYPMKGCLVDHKKMYDDTKRIFEELNIDIDPRVKAGTLTVSKRQMIEIAKAVSYDAKIIVMDEPTSSLTDNEVDHLFRIINQLKARNTSFIYISHKMEEIKQISDDITVMRDGKWIATETASALTTDMIIKMMVGRELKERYPAKKGRTGEVLLKVCGLSSLTPAFCGVDFELHQGEILGISGLVGSKRTEVLETIFGIRTKGEGKIILHGKQLDNATPMKAMKNGFAMLTEERRENGIFSDMSVSFNMIISNLKQYTKRGLLRNALIKEKVNTMITEVNVKTPSEKAQIGNLSGGNQQKAILGRWLLTSPEVLLLDEPTRGIDVGAKYEIYQLIHQLTARGKGVIVVSSEMPELLGICDRILVMSNGHQSGIYDAKKVTQVQIMEAAAKYI